MGLAKAVEPSLKASNDKLQEELMIQQVPRRRKLEPEFRDYQAGGIFPHLGWLVLIHPLLIQ